MKYQISAYLNFDSVLTIPMSDNAYQALQSVRQLPPAMVSSLFNNQNEWDDDYFAELRLELDKQTFPLGIILYYDEVDFSQALYNAYCNDDHFYQFEQNDIALYVNVPVDYTPGFTLKTLLDANSDEGRDMLSDNLEKRALLKIRQNFNLVDVTSIEVEETTPLGE